MRLLLFVGVLLALLIVPNTGSAPSVALKRGEINVTGTLVHAGGRASGTRGRQSDGVEMAWRINDRFGRKLGRMLLTCRWVVARARLCVGEIKLPLGKITVAGSSPTAFSGEYAVTGGTDAYFGSGGEMYWETTGFRKAVLIISIKN